MISATGKDRQGFSLLEILIVLAILVMFAGFFLLRFNDSDAEEKLVRSAAGIQGLALKAKKRSNTFKRDQYIVFSPGNFLLSDPLAGGVEQDPKKSVIDFVGIPDGVRVELWVKAVKSWQTLTELIWTFRDSGVSDPLRLRFSQGRSYTILDFNILTARAEEEAFFE